MQLSEATSSANPASLALLANVPVGQAAPSATSLFAEIFAAVSKTPEKSDATDATDATKVNTDPAAMLAAPDQGVAIPPQSALFNLKNILSLAGSQPHPTDNAPSADAPGGADSQSAASRLFATLGLAPSAGKRPSVPVSQTANFAPVAPDLIPQNASASPPQNVPDPPQLTNSLQQTTPLPSPDPATAAPQSQAVPPTASVSKPSIQPTQPTKASKKESAPAKQPEHLAQNSQIPEIPIALPLQTPEPFSKPASTEVQPSSSRGGGQSAPAVPSPNNTAPASNSSGNLSFAMRVGLDSQTAPDPKSQPASEQPNTQAAAPAPQPSDFAAPATPAIPSHSQPDEKPAAEHAANAPESVIALPTDAPVSTGAPEVRPAHSPEPAPAPAAEVEPKPSVPTTEPVRNMHIQLTGDDNQRVNVHLVDRGGELRLSVKSPDASLAQTLQEHMPELTTRLEQQRYRTEVWMPKEPASASSNNTNSNGSPNPGYGNSDGRQNGQQQNRPDWLEDLEDNPRRPQTTRRNQSWEQ